MRMLHVKVSPPRSPMRLGFGKKPGPEDEAQNSVSQEDAGRFLGAQLAKRLVLLPPDGPSPPAACLPAAAALGTQCHSSQARGAGGVQRWPWNKSSFSKVASAITVWRKNGLLRNDDSVLSICFLSMRFIFCPKFLTFFSPHPPPAKLQALSGSWTSNSDFDTLQ